MTDSDQPAAGEPAPDQTNGYHAVVVPGGFDPPVVISADTPEALAASLGTYFSSPAAVLCRVYPFSGVRLGVGGDPVRRLILPNGTSIDMTPAKPADADPDGFLLPPSARG